MQLKNSIAIVMLLALAIVSHTSQAYDPYWSIKGTTIAGGSHYSQQSSFSANNPVAHESYKELKAAITAPYNVTLHYELADVAGMYEKAMTLLEDAYSNRLTVQNVKNIRQSLQDLSALGIVANGGGMSNGLIPGIAVAVPAIKGTITFEYQGDIRDMLSVPAGMAVSFTPDALLTEQGTACEALLELNDFNDLDQLQSCYDNLSETQIAQICGSTTDISTCDFSSLSNAFSFANNLASVNIRGAYRYRNYLIGYSTEVWKHINSNKWIEGVVFAGAKLSYTDVDTKNMSLKFTDFTESHSLKDLLDDFFDDKDIRNNTGFGLDAGISWLSGRYSASLTLNNLISPEIRYPDNYIIKHNIAPSLAASFYLNESQSWSVRMQNDFAPIKSVADAEYMWRVLGISYTSNYWYIPAIELSKRWNLAGQKQSYNAVGFRILNFFQASAAISDTSVSGVSRAGLFSVGFGFSF